MNFRQEQLWFTKELEKHADAVRAVGEKNYMKSPLKFYGVTTPTKRKIVKSWLRQHPDISIGEIAVLAERLWDSGFSEGRDLAVQLLQYRRHALSKNQLPLVDKMVQESVSWGHLDEIAKWLVGSLIDADPKLMFSQLTRWSRSDNFWIRRAALLGQLIQFRRREGNKEFFFRLAVKEFSEGKRWSREERFFIRKAIGWVLREIAEREPQVTYRFVKKYREQMSGLTFREAVRKLPLALRAQLNN